MLCGLRVEHLYAFDPRLGANVESTNATYSDADGKPMSARFAGFLTTETVVMRIKMLRAAAEKNERRDWRTKQ